MNEDKARALLIAFAKWAQSEDAIEDLSIDDAIKKFIASPEAAALIGETELAKSKSDDEEGQDEDDDLASLLDGDDDEDEDDEEESEEDEDEEEPTDEEAEGEKATKKKATKKKATKKKTKTSPLAVWARHYGKDG